MSSFASLQNKLTFYIPGSIPSTEFKAEPSKYVYASPEQPDEDYIFVLQRDLPVEFVFQRETLQGPTTLFRILPD